MYILQTKTKHTPIHLIIRGFTWSFVELSDQPVVTAEQCMKTCRYGPIAWNNVYIILRNGGKMRSQWFGLCCWRTGWCEFIYDCWSFEILVELTRKGGKNHQAKRSLENGQSGLSWQKGYSNSDKQHLVESMHWRIKLFEEQALPSISVVLHYTVVSIMFHSTVIRIVFHCTVLSIVFHYTVE